MNASPLPPPGRLLIMQPDGIETVEHEMRDLHGIGIDSLGRLSLSVEGRGVRATLSLDQMASLAMLLAYAVEHLGQDVAKAATTAAERLAQICASQGAADA
jgi:hypothetical protein